MGHVGKPRTIFAVVGVDARHVLGVLDQRDGITGQLSEGSNDFRVAVVPDQDDTFTRTVGALGFSVNLGDQGAGRIDKVQISALGFRWHGFRNAVRGKDDGAVVGRLNQLVDKDRAFGL